MRDNRSRRTVVGCLLATVLVAACAPPGVGDPCAPETTPTCTEIGGEKVCEPWAYGEVSVETRSVQCKTRTCMVYHFFPAGRQPGEPDWRYCTTPDSRDSETCSWPEEASAQEPCRARDTRDFISKFCRRNADGTIILNPYITDPTGTEQWFGTPKEGWYCDFDMSLVNLSQPFCTVKCKGAGRTFECPEGYSCQEVVRLGPEGMRGSYCVPARLVDCDPGALTPGNQDCCGGTSQ